MRWRDQLRRAAPIDAFERARARWRGTPVRSWLAEYDEYLFLPILGAIAAAAPSLFDTRETFIVIVAALYLILRMMRGSFGIAVVAVLLLWLPFEMNSFERNIMFNVALYALLGIGLNVVVGYAGLLDLGYVAFFAAGAYCYALITAPDAGASEWAQQWDPSMGFWLIIPLALVLAAAIGVLLGIPVLRLRGDYLAIVTLGFGEIIRLMLQNQDEYTNGTRGLFLLPKPTFLGNELEQAREIYFVVLALILGALFVAERIRDSRVGRAWEAIREDEDVAAAMGVDTTYYKLLAFAIGAAIGGLGGVVLAAKQGSVFPPDFNIDVSINVLALVIIGGMGNARGILLGAFLVVGLPDVLREFSLNLGVLELNDIGVDYRLIIFGAALITVMVLRPQGLIPSRRRQLEFQHAERRDAELAT
jgi:branched-chain amino acid transport system permease protein